MRKSRGVTRHGTVSLLNMLLGREEEAVRAALEVGIVFSKEADAAALAPPKKNRPILKKVGDLIERAVDDRIVKPR